MDQLVSKFVHFDLSGTIEMTVDTVGLNKYLQQQKFAVKLLLFADAILSTLDAEQKDEPSFTVSIEVSVKDAHSTKQIDAPNA